MTKSQVYCAFETQCIL